MGKDHVTAAREGTDEIGLAVMATTFAIVAVFVPIAFMSGIIGRFFFQFGVTVAVAVLVSLFVSFTLDPMLSSVWHDPPGSRFKRVPWLGRFMDRVEHGIEWMHVRLRRRSSSGRSTHRKSVLAIALVSFVGSFALRAAGRHRVRAARPTRASSRCASTRRSARASNTPTARCAQVEAVLKAFPEIDARDDDRRHRGRPQLRAHQPEARRPRASAAARRRSSSRRSARR